MNPTLQQTGGKRSQWYVRVTVKELTADGTVSVQRRFYLGRVEEITREQAIERKEALLRRYGAEPVAAAAPLLSDFAEEWFRLHVTARLASTTQAKYSSLWQNHIKPAFGSMRLSEITPRMLQEWIHTKQEAGTGPPDHVPRIPVSVVPVAALLL